MLLDVDGTLVDSNHLHVVAWVRACLDVERVVPSWRVHRAIGMDSAELLSALLGDDAGRLGDRAKARHAEHYRDLGGLLRPLPGAQQLVRALSGAGMEVVTAEPAPDIVSVALDRAGVTAERALFVGDATWDVEGGGQGRRPVRRGADGWCQRRGVGSRRRAGCLRRCRRLLAAVSDDREASLRLR